MLEANYKCIVFLLVVE